MTQTEPLATGQTFTPYSTLWPLVSNDEVPFWVAPYESERIAAYSKYEQLYWNVPDALRLVFRGMEDNPIYVPSPRQICDGAAHFLLKGLTLAPEKENPGIEAALKKLMKREQLIHQFHTAKHSGVVRGDYVFHIIGDSSEPEGSRITIKPIDPGTYFPEVDDNDPDKITAVNLAEHFLTNANETRIKVQRYEYVKMGGTKRVASSLKVYEAREWWHPIRRRLIQTLDAFHLLPDNITRIPVYHFKNIDWQGDPFGSSELRGYEMLVTSISQSATDEDTALALEGLGVYHTDAPPPRDEDDNEVPWEISPGRVLETPTGTEFARVQGVGSVKPMQDHIKFLTDAMMDASGTFRPAIIDALTAESGVALAIKFLPTMAKIEQRDEMGKAGLEQMMFDWKQWHFAYENEKLDDVEIVATLGDKLPGNSTQKLNELNNMRDRQVIDAGTYREEMTRHFGYKFPDDIEARLKKEADEKLAQQEATMAMQKKFAPAVSDQSGTKGRNPGGPPTNKSNNKNRTNESGGTEARKKNSSRRRGNFRGA